WRACPAPPCRAPPPPHGRLPPPSPARWRGRCRGSRRSPPPPCRRAPGSYALLSLARAVTPFGKRWRRHRRQGLRPPPRPAAEGIEITPPQAPPVQPSSPLGQQRAGPRHVAVGEMLPADGRLDQSLQRLARRPARRHPVRLEPLVHFE